ncbi:MAG: polysaccharide deacetylase, partial [Methylococcaceae bacterium NSP1-2]
MFEWACVKWLPITAALGCLPVDTGNPVNTLRAFYSAIASHECEKAVALAEGYSVERCQKIASLQLNEPITVIEEKKNSAVLQFSVAHELTEQKQRIATTATVALKRVGEQWKVDFSTIKSLNDKALPVSDTPKPTEVKPEPPASPPPSKPTGLLSLWAPEALQGKAGDEKIHFLRKPDFSAPSRTQPNETLPPLKPEYLNSIRRVKLPKDKKWVALTFDLCERADEVAGYDRGVINALRDKQVKATFYAGGKWMQSHPEQTMQLMADNLFEIGNHGWTHGNLRVLQGEPMQQQIVWTQAEYERIRDNLQDKAKSAGLVDLMANVAHQPAG